MMYGRCKELHLKHRLNTYGLILTLLCLNVLYNRIIVFLSIGENVKAHKSELRFQRHGSLSVVLILKHQFQIQSHEHLIYTKQFHIMHYKSWYYINTLSMIHCI
jgi:hypothetical protein